MKSVVIRCLLLFLAILCCVAAANRALAVSAGAGVPPLHTLPGVFSGYVHPHWSADGTEFWYESFGPDWKRTFWWVNAVTGKRWPVFDCEKLHDALLKAQVIMFDKDFISLNDLRRLKGDELQLDLNGCRFNYNPTTNDIKFIGLTYAVPRPLVPLRSLPDQGDSTEETTISFVNHRHRKITIWAVNSDSSLRRCDNIYNWQEWQELPASVGDAFIVKDEAGQTLGIFQAAADPSQADIDQLTGPQSRTTTQPVFECDYSPDGKWQAVRRNDNIFIRNRRTGQELAITADGHPGDGYGANTTISWSPDSTKIFAGRGIFTLGQSFLVQSSPPDGLEPKLLTKDSSRATAVIEEPHLFDVARRSEIPIQQQPPLKPFYLRWQCWSADSKRIDFESLDPGRQGICVTALNTVTGQTSLMIDERSNSFIDCSADEKYVRLDIPETNQFIWTSERDGYNHAYLYDSMSEKLKNEITRGPWVVRELVRVNGHKRQLLCKVGGLVPGEDPYNVHIIRINLDGSGLLDLTPADGTHDVQFSPDGKYYLDTYSRIDLPTVTELRRSADASLVCTVERGDASERRAAGWSLPERFVAKGRDGKTDIYGVIYRPTHFDPAKKYPVVEEIYAGPVRASVPKQFTEYNDAMSLADRGFIVVQIDGMGTNFRSKAFHDVCWHNLADAGFSDRILWIKAAAAKYPQIDLSRVGIYGSSRGAENAVRALESHGDFYSVAVAGFGVYDDRFLEESVHWMGWPIGPRYQQQADVTDAAKIRGKLLLISGELDHICDPASTMQMVNALIKANKDFDLLVIPNADHGQYGDYGLRRREEFFVHNLLDKNSKEGQKAISGEAK